jgi:drug/metabolite transporter (DMT)-like permease
LSGNGTFLTEGVRSMFMSTLAFAFANILVKQLPNIPPSEIVFFRCLVATIICMVGLQRAGADWKGSNRTLLLLRGLFGRRPVLVFTSLQNIPLAPAMTIQYLSPIFTTVIAIFVLMKRCNRCNGCFTRSRLAACC